MIDEKRVFTTGGTSPSTEFIIPEKELLRRQKISKALKGRRASQRLNYHHTLETRKKISQALTKPIPIDKEQLEHLYYGEKLSQDAIGRRLGYMGYEIGYFMKRYGIPVRMRREACKLAFESGRHIAHGALGEQANNWKGGRITRAGGYIYVQKYGHHRAQRYGQYVAEHILVWEEYHKTLLPDEFIIHHLNGIKSDNRPENLIALSKGKHHGHLVFHELQKRIKFLENKLNENNQPT